jgi:hypothetical protein
MKIFKVIYTGNSTRFKNFATDVPANSEREAVEKLYAERLDENYFPQEDGSIRDCDGELIATAHTNTIEYDGGCFSASEVRPAKL